MKQIWGSLASFRSGSISSSLLELAGFEDYDLVLLGDRATDYAQRYLEGQRSETID